MSCSLDCFTQAHSACEMLIRCSLVLHFALRFVFRFTRDVTCPLCKAITIQAPYAKEPQAEINPTFALDQNNLSRRPSLERRPSRPSLSTMIRETLDSQSDIFVVYGNHNNRGFWGFLSRFFSRRSSTNVAPSLQSGDSVTSLTSELQQAVQRDVSQV